METTFAVINGRFIKLSAIRMSRNWPEWQIPDWCVTSEHMLLVLYDIANKYISGNGFFSHQIHHNRYLHQLNHAWAAKFKLNYDSDKEQNFAHPKGNRFKAIKVQYRFQKSFLWSKIHSLGDFPMSLNAYMVKCEISWKNWSHLNEWDWNWDKLSIFYRFEHHTNRTLIIRTIVLCLLRIVTVAWWWMFIWK